jgi:hypothetical protein
MQLFRCLAKGPAGRIGGGVVLAVLAKAEFVQLSFSGCPLLPREVAALDVLVKLDLKDSDRVVGVGDGVGNMSRRKSFSIVADLEFFFERRESPDSGLAGDKSLAIGLKKDGMEEPVVENRIPKFG